MNAENIRNNEELTVIGFISNELIDSEEPIMSENGIRQVITIDGYRKEELARPLKFSPELYRLELYYYEITLIDLLSIFSYELHSFLYDPGLILTNYPLSITLHRCSEREAQVGGFRYFLNVSEEYTYYKIAAIGRPNGKTRIDFYYYFNEMLNTIHERISKTQYKTRLKHTVYMKSKHIGMTVEPVGQGSMARLTDAEGHARILFDVGHGTPVNKNAVHRTAYKFNSDFDKVQAIFLSHWDEDHFKLATHCDFKSLVDKYWFFPFSMDVLLKNKLSMAMRYEPRLLVWEMLTKITKNNKFMVFDHGLKGSVYLAANKCIKYSCGDISHDFNNRGVIYEFIQKNRRTDFQVLIPGDADYLQKHGSIGWDVIIGSHHGSSHISYIKLGKVKHHGTKVIFSFGFHSGHQHPSFDVISFCKDKNYSIEGTSFIGWRMWGLNDSNKLQMYNDYANSIIAF